MSLASVIPACKYPAERRFQSGEKTPPKRCYSVRPIDAGISLPVGCSFVWICVMLFFISLSSDATGQPFDHMELVGQWGYGAYNAVASQGDITIYACGGSIRIFDTQNPMQPTEISSLTIRHSIYYLAIFAEYLYTLNHYELLTISIANPAQPRIVNRRAWEGQSGELFADNGILCVAAHDGVLRLFDISDPGQISLIDMVIIGEDLNDADYRNGRLYLLVNNIGMKIFEFDAVSELYEIGTYNVRNIQSLHMGEDFFFTGNGGYRIYTLEGDSIQEVSYFEHDGIGTTYIRDHRIYAVAYDSLRIYDASDPANLRLVMQSENDVYTDEFSFADDNLFSIYGGKGRRTYSIRNPDSLEVIDAPLNDAGLISNSVVINDHLYTNSYGILWSLSLENPLSPAPVDSLHLELAARSYKIMGQHNNILFMYGNGAILPVNVNDPNHIEKLDDFSCQGFIPPLVCSDSVGFITVSRGILSIDLSNPSSIIPLDTIEIAGINIDGVIGTIPGFLYVGLLISNSISILDVSDPNDMNLIGSSYIGAQVEDFLFENETGYLATVNGLFILDISDPEIPQVIGHCDAPLGDSRIKRISKSGNYIIGNNTHGHVYAFDVTVPSDPVVAGYADLQSGMGTFNNSLWNDLIYVPIVFSGVHALRFDPGNEVSHDRGFFSPKPVSLMQCYPNPCNSSITFFNPNLTNAEYRVTDLSGRAIPGFGIMAFPPKGKKTFDIQNLSSGTYLVFNKQTGRTIGNRLIVQK